MAIGLMNLWEKLKTKDINLGVISLKDITCIQGVSAVAGVITEKDHGADLMALQLFSS